MSSDHAVNDIKNIIEILESEQNKTREEIPSLYVTKTEQQADINKILKVLDKMEQKIDKLFEVK